jgi:hypothetical protein
MMSDISIKLSVSLTDGRFESSISVPISAKDKFEQMAAAWLDMMRKALTLVEPSKP